MSKHYPFVVSKTNPRIGNLYNDLGRGIMHSCNTCKQNIPDFCTWAMHPSPGLDERAHSHAGFNIRLHFRSANQSKSHKLVWSVGIRFLIYKISL